MNSNGGCSWIVKISPPYLILCFVASGIAFNGEEMDAQIDLKKYSRLASRDAIIAVRTPKKKQEGS